LLAVNHEKATDCQSGRHHPVRAFFKDPRISGASKPFHFGIDSSTPSGTPLRLSPSSGTAFQILS